MLSQSDEYVITVLLHCTSELDVNALQTLDVDFAIDTAI
jgi:hypothetical protein